MKHLSLAHFFGYSLILGGLFGAGFAIGEANGIWTHAVYLRAYFVFLLCLFALALPYSLWWWKRADEAVKEAHKWAWFWGGSLGMTAAIFCAALDYVLGLNLQATITHFFGMDGSQFIAGIAFAIIPMVSGYYIAWGTWWLRHR